MTTRRQRADAQAFDRRRLVTAYLSGRLRGSETEPLRPGRAVVAGTALALLLVAGAVISSVVAPQVPAGWDAPGLVVAKETGERYIITAKGAPLRPVVNVTSAQLILGAHPITTIVPQRVLRGRTPGEDVGILGAPEQLPDPSVFVETGWTACTASRAGVTLAISHHPGVTPAPRVGATVTADGRSYWVLAEGADHRARRYRVPELPGEDNLLEAIGLPPEAQAMRVPSTWLALFPVGGALGPGSFGLGDTVGQAVSYAGQPGIAADARVGDVATVASTGQVFLLTADGPTPLDPFAAAVYITAAELRRHGDGPRQASTGQLPAVGQTAPTWSAAHWPADTLQSVEGAVCGELHAAAGSAPYVRLGVAPRGPAWSTPAAGTRDLAADPGTGALVRRGAWGQTSGGSVWIVGDRAKAYPIQDRKTLQTLGLDRYHAPLVPEAWVEVLGTGVPLSTALALCAPGTPSTSATLTGSCS